VLPPVPGEAPPGDVVPPEAAPSGAVPSEPAEVAGPPPSEVAPPITVQPPPMAEIEVPRAPPPPPPSNGRGLLIGAAVTGVIGGVIRIATTVGVIRDIRGSSSDPIVTTMTGSFFYSPFIATAVGLAGGGMGRRGRFDAHNELFEGKPASRQRRPGLGWGLFGGGVGVWLVTRIAGMTACPTDACVGRVWETGYYLSLAGTVPGVIMGAYGSGFNGYHKRFRHLADVTVAPMAHRGAWGMGVSGRF